MKLESFTAVFDRVRWRSADGDFVICSLAGEKAAAKGKINDEGDLISGVEYQFFGRWEEHPKYGRSFAFSHFVRREPHSRRGLVRYLEKYAPGIGPKRANDLYDEYGHEAIKALRENPAGVAMVVGLDGKIAAKAALALNVLADLEEVRIELTELFDGRGFPGELYNAVVHLWGDYAPHRIRKDPFTLLVRRLPGCGFQRCDKLYLDLGHPPQKLKRQTLALWYMLNSDSSGNTWLPVKSAVQRLNEAIAGAAVDGKRAIRLGVRSKWLQVRQNGQGEWWLAEGKKANNEEDLGQCLINLLTIHDVQNATVQPEARRENGSQSSGAVIAACNSMPMVMTAETISQTRQEESK